MTQLVFVSHKNTLIWVFVTAVIRSHGFGDVPGCVRGPELDRKWISWPHLYPVGYGGAQLHHSADRTHGQHLLTGHQWPHCEFTTLSHCGRAVPFKPFEPFGRLDSRCWQLVHPLCIVSLLLLFSLWIFVSPSCLCERVKLHRARGRSSTCGTWKVNCSHAANLPSGRCQTSCVSPSRSATSGIPETWSSPAVQMASYGWGFLLCGPLMPRLLWGAQTDSQAACFRTFSLGFLYSFKCISHYFGISQVATWMSINEIITTRLLSVIANSAPSLQSKLWTINWALLGGHPYCMYTLHTPTNDIIAVLLPCVMGCACASLHMRVHWLLCWITSDFATRYVSLTQIWKTEYTRTQLPGPPEEPVSPGQDQTERDSNGTSGKMGIFT